MSCGFDTDDHCCYLGRKDVCPHLVENQNGRRWACSLMIKYNEDWDTVLESEEYKTDVAPVLEPIGINCRDYPAGKFCATCGRSE